MSVTGRRICWPDPDGTCLLPEHRHPGGGPSMTELKVPDEAIRTWATIDPDEVDAADAARAIATPVVVAELRHQSNVFKGILIVAGEDMDPEARETLDAAAESLRSRANVLEAGAR